jgi:hypothetical protein
MPGDAIPFDTACQHTAAWLSAESRLSGTLDTAGMAYIGEKLMEMATVAARAGWKSEFRDALVKVLAGVVAAPMSDMTDNEAFKLSLDLREALYLEILQFRRAAQRDAKAGAFDA